jgi:hypothetical protein
MANSTATKANSSGNTSSRRSKKSQEVNLNNTAEESNSHIDKGAQVIPMPQLKLQETPQQEATEVSAPIPLPGNRPIDSGNLQVLGTISAMGQRPIVASNIEVWDTITVSGQRPIAKSHLQISETAMTMGNRPIASNYLEGNEDLMGYLD